MTKSQSDSLTMALSRRLKIARSTVQAILERRLVAARLRPAVSLKKRNRVRPIELTSGYEIDPDTVVTHEVGRGGLSIVYALVEQLPEMPEKYSALKVLSPDPRFQSDSRLEARFRLEQWLTRRFIYKHLLTGGYGKNRNSGDMILNFQFYVQVQ